MWGGLVGLMSNVNIKSLLLNSRVQSQLNNPQEQCWCCTYTDAHSSWVWFWTVQLIIRWMEWYTHWHAYPLDSCKMLTLNLLVWYPSLKRFLMPQCNLGCSIYSSKCPLYSQMYLHIIKYYQQYIFDNKVILKIIWLWSSMYSLTHHSF